MPILIKEINFYLFLLSLDIRKWKELELWMLFELIMKDLSNSF
jgi:hypothetical protein